MNKEFISYLHTSITIFIIFGNFITNPKYVKLHFYLCIATLIQWFVNNNKCVLSELYDDTKDNGYTIKILKQFGFDVDKDNTFITNSLNYGIVIFSIYNDYHKLYVNKKG